MERFIKTVKSYPCLWNTETEEYKTNHVKEAAWRCVTKQCDIPTVREARHLWKKLRDSHRQAVKKPKLKNQPWKYEQSMEFLLPHLKTRPSSSSEFLDNFESTCQSLSGSDDSINKSYSLENNESDNSELSEPEAKSRKKSTKHRLNFVKTEVEETPIQRDMISEEIFITEQQDSSVKVFFDSMSEMCKPLPEYLQIKVQRAVFNIVMDAREENMKSNNQGI